MRRTRILILNSDPVTRRFIRSNLEAREYATFVAVNGSEASELLQTETLDLIVLDARTPNDGLELCQNLRDGSSVPIIMLSTRNDEVYKVKCFNAGADDYLTKPFGIEELIARIKAVLRRSDGSEAASPPVLFTNGSLKIQFAERRVTVNGQEVKLTPTEYLLLQELALNVDKVLTHDLLLNKVWGPEYRYEREYLRVFIGRLRRKLEPDPRKPRYLITVPWVGYKLAAGNGVEKPAPSFAANLSH